MVEQNHEYYVSLEIAKLLKEASFDWKVNHYYFTQNGKTEVKSEFRYPAQNYNKSMATMYSKSFEFEVCSRPTFDVAQRWLREVKNLVILIDIAPSYCNGKPTGYKFVIHVSCGNHICGEWKDTYEEAQEAGIKKALEMILEKGE